MSNTIEQIWTDHSKNDTDQIPESPRELLIDYLKESKIEEKKLKSSANKIDIRAIDDIGWESGVDATSSISDFFLNEIEEDIRANARQGDPEKLACSTEILLNRLDNVNALAESRLRLRVPALKRPKLHQDLDPYFKDLLDQLLAEPEAKLPAVETVKSAERLLRALPPQQLSTLPITILWIGIGSIEIRLGPVLTWIVSPSQLRWPCIKVTAIHRRKQEGLPPKVRNFILAESLLKHAGKIIGV